MTRNRAKTKYFLKGSGIIASLIIVGGIAVLSTLSSTTKNENIISLIVSTKNNPYFAELVSAAEKTIKNYPGWGIRIFDSVDKDEQQSKNIDSALILDSKAVIINPVNSETAEATGVQKIMDRKIPVVAVDRGVDNLTVDLTITSNNIKGATNLANHFKKNILTQQQTITSDSILELRGVSGAQASNDRDKGFTSVFPIDINNKKIANFNIEEGKKTTSDFLATDSTKKTKLIFAENDAMALGAIQSLSGAFSPYTGLYTDRVNGQIYVLGFDGERGALEKIKANIMYATVIQQPSFMGKTAIDEIMTAFNNNGVFKLATIDAPTVVVDKTNVDQYLK